MAIQLTIIAFLLDAPGGQNRRRVMIRPTVPMQGPSVLEIPEAVEQAQDAITQYVATQTNTPAEGITWRHPLRNSNG